MNSIIIMQIIRKQIIQSNQQMRYTQFFYDLNSFITEKLIISLFVLGHNIAVRVYHPLGLFENNLITIYLTTIRLP
jgi:hypothetical protein